MTELQNGAVVKGRILTAWMAKSRTKGTPSLHLVFDCAGEELHADIWLTEKAAGMARAQLKAIGVDIDRVSLEQVAQGLDRLKGRECDVEIQHEEWQGNITVKCQIMTGGGAPSAKELGSITSALRNAKGHDEAPTAPQTSTPRPATKPAPAPTTSPPYDANNPDDIPF